MTAAMILSRSTLRGPGEANMAPTLTYDIGVDIDDVLHPWFNTAHALCEAAGITNGRTPTQWRMYEEYGVDVEVWAKVLDDATLAGTLYNVPPIPGAVEALRRLHYAGHRIHLITARGTGAWQDAGQKSNIYFQTADWVDEFAVPHEGLILLVQIAHSTPDGTQEHHVCKYTIPLVPGSLEPCNPHPASATHLCT